MSIVKEIGNPYLQPRPFSYIVSLSREAKQFADDEAEKKDGDDGAMDECLVSDLECDQCGGPVNGNCSEHGEQEVAMLTGRRLRCNEWDYETGRECRNVLSLQCEDCGNEEIEI